MHQSVRPSIVAQAESSGRLTSVEESAARGVVAGHRARLDWLLRVPEFEALQPAGLEALALQGKRQGVGLRAAVMALPLESKFQLVRWILDRFRRHLPSATAQAMCRVMALERFSGLELDQMLTSLQWNDLKTRITWRLLREHNRYKHAQQLLFTGYRHLVAHNVAKLVFNAHYRADCLQEGAIGLLQAIDRAGDDDQDFSAYAQAWIRRSVKNFLMRQRLPVHAPVNLISEASRNREDAPAKPDQPEAPGNSRLRALILECLNTPAISIDAPAPGGHSLRDQLRDPLGVNPAEETDRADLRGLVDRLLENLTAKQRVVLNARYGLETGQPQTLAEIARDAGISHQQVSMREKRAIEKLQSLVRPVLAELRDG